MAKGYKTGGRAPGTPNKATTEFRQTIAAMLEKNASNVDLWLQQVAVGFPDETGPDGKVVVKGVPGDPAKALDLLAKLAEFGAPKLSRAELVGDDENPLQVVGRIELVALGGEQ